MVQASSAVEGRGFRPEAGLRKAKSRARVREDFVHPFELGQGSADALQLKLLIFSHLIVDVMHHEVLKN